MSAIAGVFYGDARPVPDGDLAVLARYNSPFGPDGSGTFMAPGVALQAHALRFDSLSEKERQPINLGGGVVLTWDGRLDNRADLLAMFHYDLDEDVSDVSDVSDATLVAHAYRRWGLDCFRRLLGDWSLAVWDSSEQRIVLASDYMGVRPLHYAELPGGGIAWSTSVDALAARLNVSNEPNDDYVAGRLTLGVPPGVTPFRGVHRLIAGRYLVARSRARPDVRRYWAFEHRTIQYRRQDDYDERLRELLIEAIRCRLRASGVVWAHLSGGWDSSSVVCLAHALIERGQVPATRLQPVSAVCARAPESDERAFIEAVERWCGLSSVRFDITSKQATFAEVLESPRPLFTIGPVTVESTIENAGGRVALSGEGGDAVMFKGSSHRVSLLEPLHRGHLRHFLRVCTEFSDAQDQPLLKTLAQLVPAYLTASRFDAYSSRRRLASLAGRAGTRSRDLATVYGLTPAFVARVRPQSFSTSHETKGFPRTKRPLVAALSGFSHFGTLTNADIAPTVRTTHPYMHRPLVEFVLGVPQFAFWDPRVGRAAMKRMLAGVLPPTILERTCKGSPGPALTRMVRPLAAELLPVVNECRVITRGYVDSAALERGLTSVMDGSSNRTRFVLSCIEIEVWLRMLERPMKVNATRASSEAFKFEPAFQNP